MRIDVRIDNSELLRRFGKDFDRKLAYAVATAINETAKKVQEAERANVQRNMTVRSDFVLRQVAVIKPFASAKQGRPFAEISVGQRPRLLLSQFEEGGERRPFVGKRVAVPITGGPARPSFGQPVTPSLRFKALRLRRVKGKRGGRRGTGKPVRLAGEQRTYVVPEVGVFQRTASGSRLVYKFVPSVQIRPSLGFLDTARSTAARWFPDLMDREIARALVRGRG